MKDAEKLVAWLREAADELEKAHGILDAHGFPRELEKGIAMTLAARIALALPGETFVRDPKSELPIRTNSPQWKGPGG